MRVVIRLLRDENDFRLDDTGIADHATARLDDRARDVVAEMLAECCEDRLTIGFRRRHVAQVLRREAAAHVDHLQVNALLGKLREDALGIGQSRIPGIDLQHLRTDMERNAVGFETELMGIDKYVDSHLRHATELARQRPFGPFAIRENAAEHAGAGSGAGHLLDFFMAVDRIEVDAEGMRPRNVALLLDRVAVGDTVGRCTGVERHLDFGNGGAIEARAHVGEQLEHFRSRVGLHGVIDRAIRQGVTESGIVVADHVEIDDKARTFRTTGVDEVEDALSGHRSIP